MTDTSMPETIGAYTISREIGRGGMGVVYLGHDSNLDRPVAIKALTEDLADDPERLARFEREARVLASLSHGNIATVYGFETVGDRRYLVMEFVEGETLGDRLAAEPMTVGEALSTCAQIAAGVEAAHEAGVVHRDLKPGNVIIRPDGTPKVLDFGLARELPARSSRTELSDAATMKPASNVTREGVSIGTPGYMSPEQVRGMMVDRRTDNFAFGCILYESLTGTLAFPGMTATDSIAAILQGEPDWKALPPSTPPTVQLLLRRCLQKDRRRRLRDIGDARIELEQAIDDPTSTSLGLAGAALAAAGRRHRTWRDVLPWAIAAIAIVAALLAVPATWWMTRSEPPTVMRLGVPIPADRSFAPRASPILSRSGSRMAFKSREDGRSSICVLSLDQPEPVRLEGTVDGNHHLFFSPDGEWIAFEQDGKLKKISVRGGPSTTLCPAPSFRGGSWNPDGTIVAALDRRDGLSRLLAAGGTPETLTTPDDEMTSHRLPRHLPDNRGVIFTAISDGGTWEDSALMVLPFDTMEPRRIITNGSAGRYVATGHIVFVREGTLMAAPFDLKRLDVTGPAVPVLENVTTFGPDWPAQFAISEGGTLVYMMGRADVTSELVLVDLNGVEEPVGANSGEFDNGLLSPDGRRVVLSVREDDDWNLKILELERDILRPLTFDEAEDTQPLWSPNGAWIVFRSNRDNDVHNLYRVRSDFTGVPERLTTGPYGQRPFDWSPDGRTITFMHLDPDTRGDIWLLRLDEAGAVVGEPEPFVQRRGWQWGGWFSPDGRWIAYISTESGRPELYVRPAEGPGAAEQVSTEGAIRARWSPTEDRIFYMTDWGRPTTVYTVAWSVEGTSLRAAAPEKVMEIDGSGPIGTFDVTADASRFLIHGSQGDEFEQRAPTIVLNWFEELKTRTRNVPRGSR